MWHRKPKIFTICFFAKKKLCTVVLEGKQKQLEMGNIAMHNINYVIVNYTSVPFDLQQY